VHSSCIRNKHDELEGEGERERERERGHLKEFLFETKIKDQNSSPRRSRLPQWFHLIYDSDYVRLSTM
jgi:hypothetical protein